MSHEPMHMAEIYSQDLMSATKLIATTLDSVPITYILLCSPQPRDSSRDKSHTAGFNFASGSNSRQVWNHRLGILLIDSTSSFFMLRFSAAY